MPALRLVFAIALVCAASNRKNSIQIPANSALNSSVSKVEGNTQEFLRDQYGICENPCCLGFFCKVLTLETTKMLTARCNWLAQRSSTTCKRTRQRHWMSRSNKGVVNGVTWNRRKLFLFWGRHAEMPKDATPTLYPIFVTAKETLYTSRKTGRELNISHDKGKYKKS